MTRHKRKGQTNHKKRRNSLTSRDVQTKTLIRSSLLLHFLRQSQAQNLLLMCLAMKLHKDEAGIIVLFSSFLNYQQKSRALKTLLEIDSHFMHLDRVTIDGVLLKLEKEELRLQQLLSTVTTAIAATAQSYMGYRNE